jgi:hypothetical protein
MHCKCCDKIMSDVEMRRKNSFGVYEEMCTKCLTLSFIDIDDTDTGPDDDENDPYFSNPNDL